MAEDERIRVVIRSTRDRQNYARLMHRLGAITAEERDELYREAANKTRSAYGLPPLPPLAMVTVGERAVTLAGITRLRDQMQQQYKGTARWKAVHHPPGIVRRTLNWLAARLRRKE